MKSSNAEQINLLKEKVARLNAVSPTFCLAKWKQSTTTLYNGFTHSCHHPVQHKIRVEDILKNPRGLHNTPTKMAARQDMLHGIQTKECDYCWNIENLGKDHFSDRHYKSANEGMGIWQTFDEVVAAGVGEDIAPSYLEIAFENTCNFKCAYCSPDVSSRWMEEVEQHGSYKLPTGELHNLDYLRDSGRYPIHHKAHNPYIDAFWEWWPELYQELNTFRITGGEPLLSDNTWKIIDYIIDNPRPELKFSINTNMGVPRKLIERLADKLRLLDGKVRDVVIYTSAESVDAQAEYSRFGMDWQLFTENIEYLLAATPPNVSLSFMTTVNVLSASTLDAFVEYICALRERHGNRVDRNRINFNIAYLRWPEHQSITLLDAVQREALERRIEALIRRRSGGDNFQLGDLYLEEVDQLRRLINFMNSVVPTSELYASFTAFFDEYDRRRGTNLVQIFPELQHIYVLGKEALASTA